MVCRVASEKIVDLSVRDAAKLPLSSLQCNCSNDRVPVLLINSLHHCQLCRYVPWYMQNGEQHNLLGTAHRSWEAKLSPQQLDALAPAGTVHEHQSPDARLMGWRPRHASEIEQGLPQGTHGAYGAPKRGRL